CLIAFSNCCLRLGKRIILSSISFTLIFSYTYYTFSQGLLYISMVVHHLLFEFFAKSVSSVTIIGRNKIVKEGLKWQRRYSCSQEMQLNLWKSITRIIDVQKKDLNLLSLQLVRRNCIQLFTTFWTGKRIQKNQLI